MSDNFIMSEFDAARNTSYAIEAGIKRLLESDAVVALLTQDIHKEAFDETEHLKAQLANGNATDINMMLKHLMLITVLSKDIVAWAEGRPS